MSALSPYQLMTLFFGGSVVIATILAYNGTTYDAKAKRVVDTLISGLGFFFASYALITSYSKDGYTVMYRNFILVLAVTSGVMTAVNLNGSPPISDTRWNAVTTRVAQPLLQASLFAVPLALFGFKD